MNFFLCGAYALFLLCLYPVDELYQFFQFSSYYSYQLGLHFFLSIVLLKPTCCALF